MVLRGPMNIGKALRLAGIILVGLIVLAAPLQVFGQSCALCYTQAASSGARTIAALRNGIFILIVPPMFLSVGVTVLAYRRRNQFRQDEDSLESDRNL
jgi:hypothetical protein